MKVVLIKDIDRVGMRGDVKNVTDGYARNFLFPKKLAHPATKSAIREAEKMKQVRKSQENAKQVEFDAFRKAISWKTITLSAKANEQGTLFAALTPKSIYGAITEQLKVSIDPSILDMKDSVKTTGEHDITITLQNGESVSVHVNVAEEKKAG